MTFLDYMESAMRTGCSLEARVEGEPKPKGSLRPVGRMGHRVRMIEEVGGSTEWRKHMADVFRTKYSGAPMNEPVLAFMVFRLPVLKGKGRSIWPITRSSYDLDKLVRNVGDALTDAGVLQDDSRIVGLMAIKEYASSSAHPGVFVRLASFPQNEVLSFP